MLKTSETKKSHLTLRTNNTTPNNVKPNEPKKISISKTETKIYDSGGKKCHVLVSN